MKRSFFILSLISAGGASAALNPGTYDNTIGEENGGLYSVVAGETEVIRDVNVFSYGTTADYGGAIYVGEGATLEMQGNCDFHDNYELVEDAENLEGGIANDVFLDAGATLILNPTEGESIKLGSGVESMGDARLVKKGSGTAQLGGTGETVSDYSYFDGDISVEAGDLFVRTEVNALSVEVAADATLKLQGSEELPAFLNVHAEPDAMNAVSVKAGDELAALSNVAITLNGLTSLEEGSAAIISGASIAIMVGDFAVSDISMDENATINATRSGVTLGGNNSLTIGGMEYDAELGTWVTTQLSGLKLIDQTCLTLNMTADQLSELGDSFMVTFDGLSVADAADITIATGSVIGSAETLSLLETTMTGGYLTVTMKVIPEPATATLSLLALAALATRRRRNG